MNKSAAEKALSASTDVGGTELRTSNNFPKFCVLSPVASNTLNSFPMCLQTFLFIIVAESAIAAWSLSVSELLIYRYFHYHIIISCSFFVTYFKQSC